MKGAKVVRMGDLIVSRSDVLTKKSCTRFRLQNVTYIYMYI